MGTKELFFIAVDMKWLKKHFCTNFMSFRTQDSSGPETLHLSSNAPRVRIPPPDQEAAQVLGSTLTWWAARSDSKASCFFFMAFSSKILQFL